MFQVLIKIKRFVFTYILEKRHHRSHISYQYHNQLWWRTRANYHFDRSLYKHRRTDLRKLKYTLIDMNYIIRLTLKNERKHTSRAERIAAKRCLSTEIKSLFDEQIFKKKNFLFEPDAVRI